MTKLALFFKSHVDTYTRGNGTVVTAHDDKRKPTNRQEPSGNFVHKETKKNFHWWDTKDKWALENGFPHEIGVGHDKNETRYAHVKGTVAHVAVDEGPDGKPVTEKWPIKDNWRKPGH